MFDQYFINFKYKCTVDIVLDIGLLTMRPKPAKKE